MSWVPTLICLFQNRLSQFLKLPVDLGGFLLCFFVFLFLLWALANFPDRSHLFCNIKSTSYYHAGLLTSHWDECHIESYFELFLRNSSQHIFSVNFPVSQEYFHVTTCCQNSLLSVSVEFYCFVQYMIIQTCWYMDLEPEIMFSEEWRMFYNNVYKMLHLLMVCRYFININECVI